MRCARARAAPASPSARCISSSAAATGTRVRASAANLSLFGARRVLEIRLASARPGVAGNAALNALLEARAPDMLLLILAPRLDREAQGAEWVRALEQHGAWVQLWPVDPARLGRLAARPLPDARARAERGGARAARGAHRGQPARRAPGAQQADAARRTAAPVTPEMVRASVADSARFDVFQLGDAVLAGDAARALRMLAGLRAEGSEATLVLWALLQALRDLWSVRAGEGAPGWQRQAAARAQGEAACGAAALRGARRRARAAPTA